VPGIKIQILDRQAHSIQERQFDKAEVSIGKMEGNDIVLDMPKVSRQHSKIEHQGDRYLLTDLGSTNGTFFNGRRITASVPLGPGDRIGIADYTLLVVQVNGREAPRQAAAKPQPPVEAAAKAPPAAPLKESKADAFHRSLSQEQKDQYRGLKNEIHRRLLEAMDLRRTDVSKIPEAELRQKTDAAIKEIIAAMRPEMPRFVDDGILLKEIIDEALGLGPLEDLLAEPTVSEIMVNKKDQIYIERAGRIELSPKSFSSDIAVRNVIERIVAPLGRRIDESSPLVDARLKDGSRVNAIIPPLALKGPCITIRKFAKKPLKPEDLVRFGSLTSEMAAFLKLGVESRQNIVVSGGTGSGKTTLLNVISSFIPGGERIVTIEDSAELQLPQEHVVSLEARPPNIEGKGAITIRDLVKNALRMRPDRIVVGECRGGEALDMLQAMNTGHDGSMTTGHANTPDDMVARIETMVLMSGMDLPVRAIREQIAGAVHLIVQLTRFGCGSRKITHIAEVNGIDEGQIVLQDIFYFRQTGFDEHNKVKGYFVSTGFIPHFMEEMAERGIPLDLSMFKN
jgi:pilus assembly protein CpaF